MTLTNCRIERGVCGRQPLTPLIWSAQPSGTEAGGRSVVGHKWIPIRVVSVRSCC